MCRLPFLGVRGILQHPRTMDFCKPYLVIRALLTVFMMLLAAPVWSQLKADFTIDKPGGCAPHAVSFTNTSTGTTANTTFTWTFGNGNSSTLRNPGATYYDEQVYTVTLTAKDGNVSSTKTLQVTVYKKPEVSFLTNIIKGCAPLEVELTSTSTAGDGSITNYFWDFGDGGTSQGGDLQTVSHTYLNPQKASVSLTVTNSHGCFRTLEKPALIDIAAELKAEFTAANPTVCMESDPVNFTNASTGPGTLSYTWDFGDGNSSTDPSPTHVYNQKGNFEARLKVTNDIGCEATSLPVNISVAQLDSDFELPDMVCTGSSVIIQNTSASTANSVTWTADDGSSAYSWGNNPVTFVFRQAGKRQLTMTSDYGTCVQSITKEVEVKSGPRIMGIELDPGSCGAPTTVSFRDTNSSAVKWHWNFHDGTAADTREASKSYTSDGYYRVTLQVENAEGCVSSPFERFFNISKPSVSIEILSGAQSGCINLRNKFGVQTTEAIESYEWDFGDGHTSTEAEPEHVFEQEGTFSVKLDYTTKSGCKGSATRSVVINKKPVADFVADQEVCGNTPHLFTNLTTGNVSYYEWEFGDWGPTQYVGGNAVHEFQNEGVYSVRLIAVNGNCADTVYRENYITVKPGFVDLSYFTNTCDDDRGEVSFYENSRQAETWTWDFGDGSPLVSWDPQQGTAKHHYTATGNYLVKLTITNGSCSVTDSITASVLLKQHPVLSSVTTELCSSESIDITLNGFETNPRPSYWYYGNQYYIERIEYQDGTEYKTSPERQDTYWNTTYTGTYRFLDPAKKGIRIITRSQNFYCNDTTNLIPLVIKGPIADFKTSSDYVCYKDPMEFISLAQGQNNVPIVKWEWSFGDGSPLLTKSDGGNVTHQYAEPNRYYAKLTVTDAEGCYHFTESSDKPVEVYGPKADFTFYPDRVMSQTTVQFYSTSQTYPYNSINYRWSFLDGTTRNGYSVNKYYPTIGTDTVQMVAIDPGTGCRDTAYKVVVIKDVEANFTYTTTYINNNSCPPVLASFTNTSDNYTSVTWDFGNGRSAGNLNNVSTTYDQPGIYTVTLYAYGPNNSMDSLKVPIEIKGPYAILSVDTLFGCQNLPVQLSAVVRNATSFTWDFGDGTLLQTTDTFAVHRYQSPGIYQPAMILRDQSGCASTSRTDDKIIIDDLRTQASAAPALVCDSGFVQLDPVAVSLSQDQLGLPVTYNWTVSNGLQSGLESPQFFFNQPGKYMANVQVKSALGCEASSEVEVEVVRTTQVSINGPTELCAGNLVQFSGEADRDGIQTWTWDFGNGQQSDQQIPAPLRYQSAGLYPVQLILAQNGCRDTAQLQLRVNPIPQVGLTPRDPVLCLGESIQLIANDGTQYEWESADGISSLNIARPFVSPQYTTTYRVKVTNPFGCFSNDSTTVTVGRPIQLDLVSDTSVCRGFPITLAVSGATSYNWIEGEGLNSTTSSAPFTTPLTDTRYTVVGYDAYQCFTDTASVYVHVRDLPTVSAGPDITLPTGERVQLNPVYSSDVVQYNWSPQWYLTCSNCPNPIAGPKENTTFTVTVRNQWGCVATDDVAIQLVCNENVAIPNAFTPNNDGKNDKFNLLGKGIRKVKSFRIYSRLGDVVFERTNFQIGELDAGWDGTIKGYPAATGTYVYFAEFICDTGELFARKGTIILIR